MKRLLLVLLIGLSSVANANPYHRHGGYHGHRHGGYDWMAPLIVGGVVTYVLTRPQPIAVQQQPIIIQPMPVAPLGYRYENILDANCNCYRLVLVQN